MDGARALAPRMIGRHAELQQLDDALRAVRSGSGRVVLVAGEAGVGKTRLIRAFGDQGRALPATTVLHGHCDDEDPAVPYGPFVDVVRALLRFQGPETLLHAAGPWAGDLARLLPELAPLTSPAGTDADPQMQKRRLFEAIRCALQPTKERRCHVVVLEDLHWADQTSLELIRYLARAIESERTLLLGTYRDDELRRGHPLPHLIAQLTRERLVHEVHLSPLSPDDHTRMLEAILGRAPPASVAEALYERTGGNPFFVEEVVTALLAQQQLDPLIEQARQGRGIAQIAVPPTITENILSRTADLDETTSAVLTYAAVIGRRFDFDLLARLTGLGETALLRAIHALVERRLVVEERGEAEDRFVFRHALTREAVYSDVLGRERRLKHRAVLQALEEAHTADPEAVIDLLAYHSLQARDLTKAARYARLAGGRAVRMSAYREAVAHYEMALELLETDDPRARADLYDTLAEAAYPLGDTDLYLRYWREAQRLYEQAGDRRKVADIYRRLGRVAWERGEREDAFAYTRAALAVLEAEPPGRELAMAYSALSQLHMLSSHSRENIAWGEKALDLADALGDDGVRAHALNNIGCGLCQVGEIARGIAALEESLAIAQRGNLVSDALRACLNLSDLLIYIGAFGRAAAVAAEGVARAERAGWRSHRGQLLDILAAAKIALGNWDEADALLDQIIHTSVMEFPVTRLFASTTKGELLVIRGHPDDARRLVEDIQPLCEAEGEFQVLGRLFLVLGHIYQALGDHDRAAAAIDRCLALWDEVGILIGAQELLFDSIQIYLAVGREQDARRRLRDLSLVIERAATRLTQARLEDARGVMAAYEGRHRDAVDFYQQAIVLWHGMECSYEEAKSRLRRAESLLLGGDATVRGEARDELIVAHEVFQRLGAVPNAAAAERAMRRHGLRPRPRSAAGRGGTLSPREREVLTLIVRGCSNREIAAELFISQKTTEIHVGNILAKMGCSSRTQAAALAIARGLVAAPEAAPAAVPMEGR
jgi:predicted ATPase/DNA-binding CsgD family transcriptional regulator